MRIPNAVFLERTGRENLSVRRGGCRRGLPAAQFREEAEDFQIEPDEGEHQREAAIPCPTAEEFDTGTALRLRATARRDFLTTYPP